MQIQHKSFKPVQRRCSYFSITLRGRSQHFVFELLLSSSCSWDRGWSDGVTPWRLAARTPLEALYQVQQVQVVSELVCWTPVCYLFNVTGAPGRNHGKWVSKLSLSPFRYTPTQDISYDTQWHYLLSSVCQLFPTIHPSHSLTTSGLLHQFHSLKLEGKGWIGLKDTRFQQVFVREKYLSKAFCKQRTGD